MGGFQVTFASVQVWVGTPGGGSGPLVQEIFCIEQGEGFKKSPILYYQTSYVTPPAGL